MMANIEDDLSHSCFLPYRIESFKNSVYAKNRTKCSPKNLGEAGFYFTPTTDESDQVTCYACGVKIAGLEKTSDPWTEHKTLKPECVYLKTKQSPKHELTVVEFLQIERERILKSNLNMYEQRKTKLVDQMNKVCDQFNRANETLGTD